MELREYATILMKNWVLIVVASILGIAAGAGFSFSDPRWLQYDLGVVSSKFVEAIWIAD